MNGLRKYRGIGFSYIPGNGGPCSEGHLLIFGVKASASDLISGIPMQKVIDWVHDLNGVAVPAHPYQISITGVSLGDEVFQLKGLIALETINGSISEDDNLKAVVAAAHLGIPGIGGSDAHGIHALGRTYTVFPERIDTMDDLVSALRRGGYTPQRNNKRERKISAEAKRGVDLMLNSSSSTFIIILYRLLRNTLKKKSSKIDSVEVNDCILSYWIYSHLQLLKSTSDRAWQ